MITAPTIEAQARKDLETSLMEIMPGGKDFEPVEKNGAVRYYKVYDSNHKFIGTAFKTNQKGYSSVIETIAGMDLEGKITAIKIINQNETPGLGTKVTEINNSIGILDFLAGKRQDTTVKPWFQAQFSGQTIADLDDIQAITGATISSRAVIESVKTKAKEIEGLLLNG
jgi:electron transport complex protein RnfG